MTQEFDQILDECLDRMDRGESMEACLADHREHRERLAALLNEAALAKRAHSFTPSPDAKRLARLRLAAALDKKRQPFFGRAGAWRWAGATVAALVLVAVTVLALRTTFLPGQLPTFTVSSVSADGNFAFLVSDEVNAIADFSALHVTVSKVNLVSAAQQVEFVPEVRQFDLVKLPGAVTQELWRGDVPEGDYRQAVISVSQVQGTLKSSGQTLDIKLPSDKLQLDSPFQVSAGNVTSFTYDLTVVQAGNAQGGAKYLLKPQASESGASQKPNPKGKSQGQGNGQGNGKPPK